MLGCWGEMPAGDRAGAGRMANGGKWSRGNWERGMGRFPAGEARVESEVVACFNITQLTTELLEHHRSFRPSHLTSNNASLAYRVTI